MKRKEPDDNSLSILGGYTDDQCTRVFQYLSTAQKRRLLEELPESDIARGNYIDPREYRYIVAILLPLIDIQTWGRLKRTCKYFNSLLRIPNVIWRIQRSPKYNLNDRAVAFFPWLKRLETILQTRTKDWNAAKRAVLDKSAVRNSVPYDGFRVVYPQGFIVINGTPRGTIFDTDIEKYLFDTANPYYNFAIIGARKYNRTLKEYVHRSKREWETKRK